MVQDYLNKTVGATKRVMLTYGPSGRSRGIVTVIFGNADFAAKAVKTLDGIKIDNRAMTVCYGTGAF